MRDRQAHSSGADAHLETARSTDFGARWVVSGAFSNLFTQLVVGVLALAEGVLLARMLGTEGRGAMALLMAALSISTAIAGLGLGTAAQYHLARGTGGKRGEVTTLSVMVVTLLGLGSVLGLVLMAVSGWFADVFLSGVDEGALLLLLAAPMAPILMLQQGLYRVLVSADLVRARNGLQVLQLAVTLSLIVVFLVGFDGGVQSVVVAFISATITATLLALALAVHHFGFSLHWDRSVVRDVLGFGMRLHGSTVSTTAFKRTELFLIAYLLGVSEVGIYAIANSLFNVLLTLSRATQEVAFTAFAANRAVEAARMAGRVSRGLLAASILTVLIGGAVGALLIPLVYGSSFSSAVTPFLILLLAVPLWGPGPCLTTYVTSRGRPGLATLIGVVLVTVNLGLSVPLILWLGLAGNATATVLAYLSNVIAGLYFFRRLSGLPYKEALLITRGDITAALALGRKLLGRKDAASVATGF